MQNRTFWQKRSNYMLIMVVMCCLHLSTSCSDTPSESNNRREHTASLGTCKKLRGGNLVPEDGALGKWKKVDEREVDVYHPETGNRLYASVIVIHTGLEEGKTWSSGCILEAKHTPAVRTMLLALQESKANNV